MGLTYKENVPDTRESPTRETIKELKGFGIEVFGYDPLLSKSEIEDFEIEAVEHFGDANMDCVIITVAHKEFKGITLGQLKEMMNNSPVLIDVRGIFDGEEAEKMGFYYRSL